MTYITILFTVLSLYIVDVAGNMMCVCNKDDRTQVEVYDSPQSNSTIGSLNPHQCKAIVNTSVSNQGWIALQIDNQEGYVKNDADFILVAECPSLGSQTTSAPVAISTVHPTSGCTAIHLTADLTGNLTLCPPYVRQVAKAHCHVLTQHGHSCYELNRGHVSWSIAKQRCTERGGHLVTIHTAQENSYLHNILTNTNHTNRVWIGLQDRDKEGNFHWITGEKLSYTNWSVNATHDGAGHAANNKQDCAVLTPAGHWQDVVCGGDAMHRYSYICEYSYRTPDRGTLHFAKTQRTNSYYSFQTEESPQKDCVLPQPLQMPAESFPCGAKNVRCERWGYDACLYRDEEYLCLPCSHEYLITLCGTKEEIQGCNLFCSDVALEKERQNILLTFNKTFSKLLASYSKNRTKELLELKAQNERIQKETNAQINRTKELEADLEKRKENIQQKEIYIIALTVALGVAAFLVVTLLVTHIRNRNTKKSCNESGIPEVELLMLANRKTPECTDIFVQTDEVTNERSGKEEKATQTEDKSQEHFKTEGNCLRCPGKAMLQNIKPIENEAHGKIAIQRNEHRIPNH